MDSKHILYFRKLDLELEYTLKKHLNEDEMAKYQRPVHLNLTLSSKHQLSQLELPKTLQSYGLIGLHPCGNLGPILLRHFVTNEHVKYLCVVGCCYMKLSCGDEGSGYPMSDFVRHMDDNTLSYASREIACHAIEVYLERLVKGDYHELKVSCFGIL